MIDFDFLYRLGYEVWIVSLGILFGLIVMNGIYLFQSPESKKKKAEQNFENWKNKKIKNRKRPWK